MPAFHPPQPFAVVVAKGNFWSKPAPGPQAATNPHCRKSDSTVWSQFSNSLRRFTLVLPLSCRRRPGFIQAWAPAFVFRAEGVLWIAESETRHVFHLVGQRFTLDESRWLGPMRNQLVLIGRNLDREQLRRQLEECLTGHPPRAGACAGN